jgi:DUF1009 family protein
MSKAKSRIPHGSPEILFVAEENGRNLAAWINKGPTETQYNVFTVILETMAIELNMPNQQVCMGMHGTTFRLMSKEFMQECVMSGKTSSEMMDHIQELFTQKQEHNR